MTHADFVHLRVHSAYSLSEGAIHVKALVKLCLERRMPAVALTDTGNLFGALEFSEEAAKAGIQPIVGCALAVSRETERRPGRRPEPERMVFLAQNQTGYANLLKLSSKAYLETPPGEVPQVPLAAVALHAGGLICLTGGAEGPLGRLLLDGQAEAAELLARELAAAFPGRLYVELQRHDAEAEHRAEAGLVELAYKLDLPLVATNDAYFAKRDMHEAHDILLCIDQGVSVALQERRRVTPEHYFKSAEEMRELFADLPEAIENTLVIARRCAFRPTTKAPILPRFSESGDEGVLLRRMAGEGLEERSRQLALDSQAAVTYRQRLDFELDVIEKMGFAGYFLIVADFIQWAKRQGVPVGPGRGSGAGSLAAYSLKITDLDPLRFGLLFERFLNPERVSMPDFDIDFCQDRRDEVIRYVQDRYGHDQVAQIITFGKLQARAVLRDVGRVMGLPYGQIDRLTKLVPNNPANPVTLAQAVEGEPRLQEEKRADPAVGRLIDVAMKLEGLYRHASTHAAGLVIGDRRLDELVPLYRDPRSDMPVTQFNMKWVEPAGLVKFDFLGLKTLTVLQRAVELVRAKGVPLDLDSLPLDDRRTYELLCRGEALGVFQLEGSGMRDTLRKLRPDKFEDIIALVALYRPGPMDNIPKYIAVKHGEEKAEYPHPSLKPILEETYGVAVYQEQVMQIAQVLSGFTLGEADLLRRAMGKKIKSEMDAQRERFVSGALARGVAQADAEHIFELVEKFAGYGFNKSHAAAYALIAYQTGYLKANHPLEFLAASMTLDMGNTDKLNIYRQELDRIGVALRGPDVNRSEVGFSVERGGEGQGAIRYGLAAIRNVGAGAMQAVVAERAANGPFRSIWDFAARLDPKQVNKRQLENLARAGAFDGLLPVRAQAFHAVDAVLRYASQAQSDRQSKQVNLFGGPADDSHAPAPPLPLVAEWPATEKLAQEFEAVGFYLSAHPLDAYKAALERDQVQTWAYLREAAARGGNYFKIAGAVLGRQERRSAKGNRFAFVQLSDPTGMYEVMVFSELLSAHRELLEPGRSVVLEVEARSEGDQIRLSAQKIVDIEHAAARTGAGLRIYLRDAAPLPVIHDILNQNGRGRAPITLLLALDDCGKEVELPLGAWAVTPALRGAIKGTPGVVDVHDA
jgi:DNA polymerase-3 subunit alpha